MTHPLPSLILLLNWRQRVLLSSKKPANTVPIGEASYSVRRAAHFQLILSRWLQVQYLHIEDELVLFRFQEKRYSSFQKITL